MAMAPAKLVLKTFNYITLKLFKNQWRDHKTRLTITPELSYIGGGCHMVINISKGKNLLVILPVC